MYHYTVNILSLPSFTFISFYLYVLHSITYLTSLTVCQHTHFFNKIMIKNWCRVSDKLIIVVG